MNNNYNYTILRIKINKFLTETAVEYKKQSGSYPTYCSFTAFLNEHLNLNILLESTDQDVEISSSNISEIVAQIPDQQLNEIWGAISRGLSALTRKAAPYVLSAVASTAPVVANAADDAARLAATRGAQVATQLERGAVSSAITNAEKSAAGALAQKAEGQVAQAAQKAEGQVAQAAQKAETQVVQKAETQVAQKAETQASQKAASAAESNAAQKAESEAAQTAKVKAAEDLKGQASQKAASAAESNAAQKAKASENLKAQTSQKAASAAESNAAQKAPSTVAAKATQQATQSNTASNLGKGLAAGAAAGTGAAITGSLLGGGSSEDEEDGVSNEDPTIGRLVSPEEERLAAVKSSGHSYVDQRGQRVYTSDVSYVREQFIKSLLEAKLSPAESAKRKAEKQKYKVVYMQDGKKVEVFAGSVRGVRRAAYGKTQFRVYDNKGSDVTAYFKRLMSEKK